MKRTLAAILLLVLVCVPMIASTQANDELSAMLEGLSDDELMTLLDAATQEAAARGLISASAAKEKTKSAVMVWIPKSGKKYHDKPTCSGMTDPSEVTLDMAKELGYTPCKKCKPPQ